MSKETIYGISLIIVLILVFIFVVIPIGDWFVEAVNLEDWLKAPVSNLRVIDIICIGGLFRLFGVFNPSVEVKK